MCDDADGRMADLIDRSIREASMFHHTFGCYAQGVVEAHDLWISKAIAGRHKDVEFCRALVQRGLVGGALLRDRLAMVTTIDPRVRAAAAGRIPA